MCGMEALLLLHFPFDDKGSLSRLLLYLMEKYIDSCLRFNGQEETKLYMVVIPVHVKKRPQIYTAFPYTVTILFRSTEEQRDQRARTPRTTNIHRLPTYIGRHHMKDERR